MAWRWTIKLGLLAGGFSYLAVTGGGYWWMLAWPGFSFGLVGLADLGPGPGVFGKRPDGGHPWLHRVVSLPYLLITVAAWHLWRISSREDPWELLSEGLYLGRRPGVYELPEAVRSVVDLTGELTAPASSRP